MIIVKTLGYYSLQFFLPRINWHHQTTRAFLHHLSSDLVLFAGLHRELMHMSFRCFSTGCIPHTLILAGYLLFYQQGFDKQLPIVINPLYPLILRKKSYKYQYYRLHGKVWFEPIPDLEDGEEDTGKERRVGPDVVN